MNPFDRFSVEIFVPDCNDLIYASPAAFLHFVSNCLKFVTTTLLSAHSPTQLRDLVFSRLSLELEQHNMDKHFVLFGVGIGSRGKDRRQVDDDETRPNFLIFINGIQESTTDKRSNLESWLTISVLMSAPDRLEPV